jgi:hypothetical protein
VTLADLRVRSASGSESVGSSSMNHPFRNLLMVVGVLLGALVLIEFTADGLQKFSTRGSSPQTDFVAPTNQGSRF